MPSVPEGRQRPFPPHARLYLLLTRSLCVRDPLDVLAATLRGGVDLVQVREPTATDRDLYEWLRTVRARTESAGVPLVVNNRPDLARIVGADGVHVGQDDLPVEAVRRILAPTQWIGLSTHSVSDLRRAAELAIDYVGIGPLFDTSTKGLPGLGLAHLRENLAVAPCPGFGIGGLTRVTLPAAVAAGLRRAAVSGALCKADDPEAEAAALKSILNSGQTD